MIASTLPSRPLSAKPAAAPQAAKAPVAPVAGDRFVATQRPAAAAAPAGRAVVVPGEKWRTALCLTSLALNPLVQATQTLGILARTTFGNPLLQGGSQLVLRAAGALASSPLVNNPVTRGALRVAGIALPLVNTGILLFDGYAAWQTVTNPAASGFRKGLTIARLACNAVATGLSFVPGTGAVLAMAPAWASIGLDLWIKRLNGQEK